MRILLLARAGAVAALGICALASCAPHHMSSAVQSTRSRVTSTSVALYGTPLDLHIAAPVDRAAPGVLVLYASGDGGWFGAAVDMFRQIARAGYPAVGFSSRAFLRINRPAEARSLTALAADYDRIAARARDALGLDAATRVVLTGWSRGAAFAVLVGSEPVERDRVRGVVAIGLADGEDLMLNGDEDDEDADVATPGSRHPHERLFDTYGRISRLGSIPCAVIQATRDNYLPAAHARQLFGEDSPQRRFYAIEAKNHRFSGGTEAFDMALVDALGWVVSR